MYNDMNIASISLLRPSAPERACCTYVRRGLTADNSTNYHTKYPNTARSTTSTSITCGTCGTTSKYCKVPQSPPSTTIYRNLPQVPQVPQSYHPSTASTARNCQEFLLVSLNFAHRVPCWLFNLFYIDARFFVGH